jgi:hypothetical protein
MVVTVAWGLLLITGVVLMLQHAAEVDRRQMEEEDRLFRAKFDLPEGPETLQDHGKPLDNRPDMMNRSRRTENVPEIAKSEGVSRGNKR